MVTLSSYLQIGVHFLISTELKIEKYKFQVFYRLDYTNKKISGSI